jgi:hypothetical protein
MLAANIIPARAISARRVFIMAGLLLPESVGPKASSPLVALKQIPGSKTGS